MNDPYSILESDLRHIKINHIVYPLNEEDESLNQLIEVLNSEEFADKINYQLIGISTENLEIGEPTSQDETAEVEAAAYALAKRMIALLKAWGAPTDSEDYLDSTTLVSYLFTSAEIEDLNDRLFAKIEELRAKAGLDSNDDDKKPNRPFRHQKIAEQIPARQIEELKPGMELDGIVSHTKNYGVFVDIGLEQPSLVHQSELATPGTRPNRYMIGYKVRVKVLSIDMDNKRAHLSMRNVQDPNVNIPQQSYQPRRPQNGGNGYRGQNIRYGQNQYQGGYQNHGFNNHYAGGNREGGYQNHYRNDQYRNDGMNRQEGGYQGNGYQGGRSEYQNTPRNDYQGNNYQGGHREGGHREGGYREGGHREGGFRQHNGYQNNGNRQDQPYQKNFQGGNRQDQGFNDGNFRSQNNFRNNHNNGGYQNRDRQQNGYYGEGQNQQDFRPSYQRTPRNQYQQQSSTSSSSTPDLDSMFEKKKKD
jgi:predicted RNA-binding protein with RPS1 domain